MPLREIGDHFPVSCKPERELYFFKLFFMEQVAQASAGSMKEQATEDLPLCHNLVNLSFYKIG